MICRNCGSNNEDDAVFCSKCGKALDGKSINKPLGMKWFKFIIYVQLILAFFMDLFSAYTIFAGIVYFEGLTNITAQVYSVVPALKLIDMSFAVVCVGMAVFSVYVRQKLVNYRLNAGNFYLFFLAITALSSLLYNGIKFLVSGIDPFSAIFIFSLLETMILLLINFEYFKKRKHLFIN